MLCKSEQWKCGEKFRKQVKTPFHKTKSIKDHCFQYVWVSVWCPALGRRLSITSQMPRESYEPATRPRWPITTLEPSIKEREVTKSSLKGK